MQTNAQIPLTDLGARGADALTEAFKREPRPEVQGFWVSAAVGFQHILSRYEVPALLAFRQLTPALLKDAARLAVTYPDESWTPPDLEVLQKVAPETEKALATIPRPERCKNEDSWTDFLRMIVRDVLERLDDAQPEMRHRSRMILESEPILLAVLEDQIEAQQRENVHQKLRDELLNLVWDFEPDRLRALIDQVRSGA